MEEIINMKRKNRIQTIKLEAKKVRNSGNVQEEAVLQNKNYIIVISLIKKFIDKLICKVAYKNYKILQFLHLKMINDLSVDCHIFMQDQVNNSNIHRS